MTTRIEFEQWVPAEIGRVFAFFANPKNLPRIMPPEAETRLENITLVPSVKNGTSNLGSFAGAGSEIVTSFRLLPFFPFRTHWTAVITEFEWNHSFSDLQKSGPFRSFHHRHEFQSQMREGRNGTIVRDILQYDLGFGFLGACAEKLFVARQLRHIFNHRQAALLKLLG